MTVKTDLMHTIPAAQFVTLEAVLVGAISMLAIVFTTPELAVGVSAVSAIIGVVVWLVRLEGRVNLNGALLERIERNVERLLEK